MRKLWLTFTAMLLCSIASFAQIEPVQPNEGNGTAGSPYKIDTPAEFMWINSDNDAHYELTADINLGTYHADNNNFVITSFSGTFDGGNNTITYNGSFKATSDQKIGLFGTVSSSGTIKDLNLNGNITVSGDSATSVRIGLLCGELNDGGTIEFCDVTGNINSTVKANGAGNSSAGIIIGSNKGTLQYCTGHGNVIGVGYAGGLVGSMGTMLDNFTTTATGEIKGCYFTGNVTANNSNTISEDYKAFAGGICGYVSPGASIDLCIAEAVIVTGQQARGITFADVWSTAVLNGTYAHIANTYCSGTINGLEIDSDDECVNMKKLAWIELVDRDNTYNPGTSMTLEQIESALNQARGDDDHFYFDIINGKLILIVGEQNTVLVCADPINLVVTNDNGSLTASWQVVTVNNPATIQGFVLSLDNEEMEVELTPNNDGVYSIYLGTTQPSTTLHTFTVQSICSAQEDENSNVASTSFYVSDPESDCQPVSALQVSNIASTTANVTWQGDADIVKLGEESIDFTNGQPLVLNNLEPATTYTIEVIVTCAQGESELSYPVRATFTTHGVVYETARGGDFNSQDTWSDGVVPPANDIAIIIINKGHEVIVNHDLVITGDYKIVTNDGVLKITQQGQLINTTTTNVPGIIEIVSSQKANQAWTFIGAPFENGYKLETIVPVPGNDADGISDISVKKYDYEKTTNGTATPGWSDSWAHIDTEMKAGEGYFGYPFYGGVVTFTTYGDVCTWDNTNGRYVMGSYNFENDPVTALNNGDVTITETISATQDDPETIGVSEAGYWMALSNPYPAKLNVNLFKGANNLQGNCVYVFKNGAFDMPSNDEIAMTEGFFVNFGSAGEKTITFNKGQLSYNNQSAKASANEFIKLTLINGDNKVRAYLAHNEDAEQGYDIFDANKLFAPTEIAEPYFVTDGISLMKEEFAELPYYATMNVRSFADDTVSFVVNNIPEGLAVSIIDGENIIDMVEGGVYTTEILTGENADRFKVLIKKSVSISDVEELEVNITNNNRHISIETTETDLQVEVYNALGQKVLSTKDRNFTLNQVSAGAYLIKAFNNKASKTQKIVVK